MTVVIADSSPLNYLTLIGSVANLIVLEATKHEVEISFVEYLKVGAPLTLLTLAAGVLLLRFA